MIHAEILDLLSLVAQRSLAAPLPQANALAQRAPGEHFSASVEAPLPSGGFVVRVGGQQFAMQLPSSVQTGDRLDLVLLSGGARPVFELQGTADPKTVLSPTARLVDELLQQAPAKPAASAQPLVTTPADSRALAQALAKAIGASGLFYESHQAQWLRGERSLDTLREEPQAQLAPTRAPASPRERGTTQLVRTLESPREWGAAQLARALESPHEWSTAQPARTPESPHEPGTAQPGPAPESPRGEAATRPQQERAAYMETPAARIASDATAGMPTPRLAPEATQPRDATPAVADKALADPQAMPLVRQQIETLESRQILWRGEIWPQQQAQWSISEDAPENADREAPPQWRSRLQLELPALGALHASLSLGAAGVGMRISAADPQSAATLRSHLPQLAGSLAARGIPVLGLEVVHAATS